VRSKGKPFRRCGCRNPQTGRKYGSRCPQLADKSHGSWWYRYEAPTTGQGGRRQPLVGPFRTEKAASKSLLDTLAGLAHNEYVDTDRSLTVAAYLDEWIAGKANLKTSTRASYVEHIELYFKPGIGHLRLVDLRDRHIEDLYAAMRRLGHDTDMPGETIRRLVQVRRGPVRSLSPTRLRRIHATLRSALNTAVKRKRIIHSPAEYIELATGRQRKPLVWTPRRVEYWRRTGRRPGPVMVWTPEQAAAFLDFVADDDLYALWRLIAYRGVRRGEAVGLPDYDVDLDSAIIDIRAALARAADLIGGDDLEDPKSEAGTRSISLDTGTIDALRVYRQRQVERRNTLGAAWVDSGRFFTRPTGEPLDSAWVTQRFGYLVDRAGSRRTRCAGTTIHGRQCARRIAGDDHCRQHGGNTEARKRDGLPPVRLHDLRHGSATYALAAGIATKVVSEDLGHARVQTTENLYVSVLPELKQAAADAVAETISRSRRR
jgi:integrase